MFLFPYLTLLCHTRPCSTWPNPTRPHLARPYFNVIQNHNSLPYLALPNHAKPHRTGPSPTSPSLTTPYLAVPHPAKPSLFPPLFLHQKLFSRHQGLDVREGRLLFFDFQEHLQHVRDIAQMALFPGLAI